MFVNCILHMDGYVVQIHTMKLLVVSVFGGFGAIVLVTQFLFKGVVRAQVVGWICLVFSLCVFVAPLCIVVIIIKFICVYIAASLARLYYIIEENNCKILFVFVLRYAETSNPNKECGTYALFAIGFPHTKCGCMVLLWSTSKRLQYCCKFTKLINVSS